MSNEKELTFTGTIISISPIQNISEKFRKQEFVLSDTDSEYPQFIQFEFHKDKCDKLANYKAGDRVAISYNLNGRQWTNPEGVVKTFNTLVAWRISTVAPQASPSPYDNNANDPSDDLPF